MRRQSVSGNSMSLLSKVYRLGGQWAKDGLDFLVPPRCVICGNELFYQKDSHVAPSCMGAENALICLPCCHQLMIEQKRCVTCGERSCSTVACVGCKRCRHGCRGLAVLGSYGDDLRVAVLRCKRRGGEEIASALAFVLAATYSETIRQWGVQSIIPVPMHWSRRVFRGMSAADQIAESMAKFFDLPYRCPLRRVVATKMQKDLPFQDRKLNVANVFKVRQNVVGQTFLLVDDVCTTGSTLSASAQCLMAAGAHAVYAAVIAKADFSDEGSRA